jgi:ketosteroid isomerase-like protein
MLVLAVVLLPGAAFAEVGAVAETAGRSYGEWSAAWWQWAESFEAAQSPLAAEGAVDCTLGQEGPVWFLAGGQSGAGGAVRSCTIPTGKALFFPVLNVVDVNTPGETRTVGEKRSLLSGLLDAGVPGPLADLGLPGSEACDLQVTLNGAPVTASVPLVRVQSPPFRLHTTAHPLDLPPHLVDDEAVADGFYVMLPTLTAGPHTLHIRGRLCEYQGEADHAAFAGVDVTYHLNVVGSPLPKDEMDRQGRLEMKRNVRIIQSLYDAFAGGDGDTILAILDEDVVWIESEGIPYGGTFIGRDAVFEGVFGKIAAEWDNFTATVDDMFAADGNRVIVQQRDGGTFKATGKSMLATAISIWTLDRQGRVIRFEQVIDTQEVNSATIP